MKFKMRVLHYAPGGNADNISAAIARSQETTCDQIPPAYNCENEKLAIICAEVGKKADDKLVNFIHHLSSSRVRNIAFLTVSGSAEAADGAIAPLKEMAKRNGINVLDDVFHCTVKNGFFKKGKVTQTDLENAVDWADKVVNSLL